MQAQKSKIKVGILGATGAVGQRFTQMLAGHPWFEVGALTASDRSVGKSYEAACKWLLRGGMPPGLGEMVLVPTEPGAIPTDVKLLFSALPSGTAGAVEEASPQPAFAVCSNAAAHRMDPDVPLLIPDVNPEHTALIPTQRGAAQPARLHRHQPELLEHPPGLRPQAAVGRLRAGGSERRQHAGHRGAGYPGVPALDILDNMIPYIGGEEEKMETEPRKLSARWWQTPAGRSVAEADFRVSAQANRVAVRNGHLEAVSVKLRSGGAGRGAAALTGYTGEPQRLGLPSAPNPAIILHTAEDRPQPRLDRLTGGGMPTHVGRLRPDAVFDYKFLVLGHNTVRGAAGGAVLNGELLCALGYLA